MKILKHSIHYIKTHRAQLTKFTVFGFLVFGINLFFFHLFYGVFDIHYKIAISLAYIIGVLSHFLLHRTFTFGATKEKAIPHISRYIAMLIFNYLLTLTVVWVVVDFIKISPYFGLVASTGATAAVSFFIMKYFVFTK